VKKANIRKSEKAGSINSAGFFTFSLFYFLLLTYIVQQVNDIVTVQL